MDRALVEVLITTSLICLSVVITTSSSLLYTEMSQKSREIVLEKTILYLAATIKEAAASSVIREENISIIVSLQNPILVETLGDTLRVSITNLTKSIYLGINLQGGGAGTVFNITASR
ncbi:MAG: hypothetical protein ACUVQ5_04420, partial [Candidatus Methanomethylicaceae archaeon]